MSEPEMDLPQRLAVQKLLSERLVALRSETLLPQAQDEMEPGERRPAKFAGKIAAWITMPRPSKRASVTDEGKLLAWVRENNPRQVETVWEVIVSDALIDFLADKAPQFLRPTERVTPEWVEDSLKGLKERGRIADYDGNIHTEVPGITVGYGESVPRVALEPDAALIIGQAWRDGTVTIPSLLALSSPEGEPDAT